MMENKALPTPSVNGLLDKSKELQKEILMEKLRSKTYQNKNLSETSKAVRMAMLDKRWAVDSADKMILQKCLDSLQHCIKVNSLQSLIERLECLSRQLGLKFVVGTSGVNLFISSDMFYLEILVEANGTVKDVKIHHEGKIEQQSCDELVLCISKGDFSDFTAQLEGLTAVYQLNAEKKVKCKAFSALQSLEEDLCTLKQLQSYIKEPWAQVHKSPIGFLQKRRGGHAMRLTYFVSPYELLDKEKGLQPLTVELLTVGKPNRSKGLHSLVAPTHTPLGYSAQILLEGSTANKLQLSPIISSGQRTGKGSTGPVYAPLVPQNSAMLPACFTLKLSHPMPLCSSLVKLIQTSEVEIAGDWANAKPMLGLIAQQAFEKLSPNKNVELNLNKGLFVNLPECYQCFLLCETRGFDGCVVGSIPFTHPSQVPTLITALRQQALFNTLIASTLRVNNGNVDLEQLVMFEVSALSWQSISIALEHPLQESMCTVELELSDASSPRASLSCLGSSQAEAVDEHITRVLQKSLSIPVTLRALIKIWEREASSFSNGFSALESANFSSGAGGLDPGGQNDKSNGYIMPNNVSHPQGGTYLSDSQRTMSMLCQEDLKIQERKTKKRKSEDAWNRKKLGEDSDSGGSNYDSSSNPGSPMSQDFGSDLEIDALEALGGSDNRVPSDPDNSNSGDIEDLIRNSFQKSEHKRQKFKNKEPETKTKSTTALLLDLTDGKPLMPSSVSITPIAAGTANSLPGGNVNSMMAERRPGIEIIPITTPPATLPSSITITPITSSQAKSMDERIRSEKKLSRSSDERKEKKKKKRRDDSMGPPNKVPLKQDPLTKPVSVSIKPTEGSPIRFSPSPTGGRSPNKGVASPKHSSSGKPSMSTLKSAAGGQSSNKTSSGYDLSKKPSKDSYNSSSREKEKKHSGLSFSSSGRSSPKLKNSQKLKQLEITPVPDAATEPLISPPNVEMNKSSVPSAVRNRKGSLSAVIDKLKSAQHVGPELDISPKTASSSPNSKSSDPKNSMPGLKINENKNQEYMVKPSSDGMKITINKTRTKESSGSSNSSKLNYSSSGSKQSSPQLTPPSQGSPKTHTGLKPGVISGPASKKTQVMQSSKSPFGSGNTPPKNMNPLEYVSTNSNSPKMSYKQNSNTGMNLSKSSSKSNSGSPKSNTDMTKIIRDREREKARAKLMGSKSERHSSPSSTRDEVDGIKPASKESNFLVEGLIKPLDTSKFQIPKLKNQNASDKGSPGTQYDNRSLVNDLSQNKYPFQHFHNPSARPEEVQKTYPLNVPKPLLNLGGSISPKTIPNKEQMELKGQSPRAKDEPLESKDNSEMRPPAPRSGNTTPHEAAEMLLDFSGGSSKVSGLVAVRPMFPASPALLQLTKSPAPSPHSNSPCITDDELMDEALVGPGK